MASANNPIAKYTEFQTRFHRDACLAEFCCIGDRCEIGSPALSNILLFFRFSLLFAIAATPILLESDRERLRRRSRGVIIAGIDVGQRRIKRPMP